MNSAFPGSQHHPATWAREQLFRFSTCSQLPALIRTTSPPRLEQLVADRFIWNCREIPILSVLHQPVKISIAHSSAPQVKKTSLVANNTERTKSAPGEHSRGLELSPPGFHTRRWPSPRAVLCGREIVFSFISANRDSQVWILAWSRAHANTSRERERESSLYTASRSSTPYGEQNSRKPDFCSGR